MLTTTKIKIIVDRVLEDFVDAQDTDLNANEIFEIANEIAKALHEADPESVFDDKEEDLDLGLEETDE